MRGLNFGFVTAQDMTVPGNGSASYIQPVGDLIANANTANSSHTLSISTGGGFVINLSNGNRLSVTVPTQTFSAFGTGNSAQSLTVSASFVLTEAAEPEPSTWLLLLAGLAILTIAGKRLPRPCGLRRLRISLETLVY